MAGEVPLVGRLSFNEQKRQEGKRRIWERQVRLTSAEKGRRWCHMLVRVSCQFGSRPVAAGRGQIHQKGPDWTFAV